ncbi:MAG: hypothetical protein VX438_11150, partial [Planctomycetota bacterium]|nr:hypothetical protein [Planctomycetota bacterium]
MLRANPIFLLFISQCFLPVSIFGQSKASSTERNTDLTFTSSVNVSLQGTKIINEFKLVDDLGFEYDIMSVLKNKEIRDELNVTDKQFAGMKSIQQKMTEELVPKIAAGISSKDRGKELEAHVKATELILKSNLDSQQLTRFEQIKNQIRFDRFGATALATSSYLENELNLPVKLAKSISEKVQSLKSKHLQKVNQLYRQAHQKILEELPSADQNQLDSVVTVDFRKELMARPLFITKPKRRFRNISTAVSFSQLLSDKSIRDAVEIVDSQFQEIMELKKRYDQKLKAQSNQLLSGSGRNLSISDRGKQLVKLKSENKRAFEHQLRNSLLDHQIDRLVEIAILVEVKQAGTIQCICNGTLAERIGLKTEDAKKMHSKAVDLHLDLQSQIRQLESEL